MSAPSSPGRTTVSISRQPIELYQLLKLAQLVQSGGEAKFVISDGQVRVNSMVETRKRKKIMEGDRIEFAGEQFEVVLTS